MIHRSYIAVVTALVLGTAVPVCAQWSNEPAISPILVVENANAPKIATDNDGGTYVSFRGPGYNSNAKTGGFDIFIQHYDALGNQSWDAPIQVYDTSKTFASSYGVATDTHGNVYVANDIYEANNYDDHSTVHLTKITKDGKLPWGDLNLTPGADLPGNGFGIALDAYGEHIVTTWAKTKSRLTVDSYGAIACINSDGKILWSKDVNIDGKYTFVTKPIVMDDAVIVLIEVGINPGTTRSQFMMQKYALTDGTPMWSQPVNLTSGDNQSHPINSGNAVKLVRDGQGGVALSYYHVTGPNQGILYLQHIHADGSKSFSGPGLRISGEELGNGPTSIAFDGDNYYVTWSAKKIETSDGATTEYSAIKGVAVNKQGKFLWDTTSGTLPSFIEPWKPINRSGPVNGWFSGYFTPSITLNENGNLNLTYGIETSYRYSLQAQVLDVKNGSHLGNTVSFSNGPIDVQGEMSYGRTIFGQPLLAYTTDSVTDGNIRLINFDGNALSGVSQDVLVQKVMPVELTPNSPKNLTLKVLDSQGSSHDNSVASTSGLVNTSLTASGTELTVNLSTDVWLKDSDTVNVKVQDLDNTSRVGVSNIKVHAPAYQPPRIASMETITVDEGTATQISAAIYNAENANLTMEWQQTAGQQVQFTADGAHLEVTTDYIAEDTVLTFSLTVNDGSQTATESVDLMVKNSSMPAIKGNDVQAAPGEQFNIVPEFENAKAPVSVSWSQVDGPRTIYTIAEDGTLNGTAPLSEGAITLAIQAVDANGELFSKDFSLNVAKPSVESNNSGGSLGGLSLFLLGITGLMLMCRRAFNKKQL